MIFFGYIYYRVGKHFLSMGRKSAAGGAAAISLIQALLIAFCIKPFIKALSSPMDLASNYNKGGFGLLIILVGLMVINWGVHVRRYNEYDSRWGNEDFKTRSLKGILVIIFLMSPLLLLMWLQYQPWF